MAIKPLPEKYRSDPAMLCGCVAGAATIDEVARMLENAGFTDVRIEPRPESRALIAEWFPESGVEEYVASADIRAVKR